MTRIEQLEQKVKRLEQKICCKTQFFDTVDDLPSVGLTGVIYVTDDGNIYVWNGIDYILNGLGDAYYTNSYVERLKALGSDVQYSNYSNATVNTKTLTDGRIYLQSVFIPKTSIISTIGWRQISTGIYTPDNYNGVGIYSMNTTTGDLTLLSKSVDDGTTWSTVAANAYGSKNLTTPVSLNKGIYFLAYLYNSSASSNAPSIGSDTLSLPSFQI